MSAPTPCAVKRLRTVTMAFFVVLLLMPTIAPAQQNLLGGIVLDQANKALVGVHVRIYRGDKKIGSDHTDNAGAYSISFPKGTPLTTIRYELTNWQPEVIENVGGSNDSSISKILRPARRLMTASERRNLSTVLEHLYGLDKANGVTASAFRKQYATLINVTHTDGQVAAWLPRIPTVRPTVRPTVGPREHFASTVNNRMLALLSVDKVRGELRLDARQQRDVARIESQRIEYYTAMQSEVVKAGGPQTAGLDNFLALHGIRFTNRLAGNLERTLQPKQLQRLSQIAVQQLGYAALLDDAVASRLELTEDQSAHVTNVARTAQSNFLDFLRNDFHGKRDAESLRKLLQVKQKIDASASERALSILSTNQKQQLARLSGTPFELPPSRIPELFIPKRGFRAPNNALPKPEPRPKER